MKAVVFAGPSVPADEIRARLGAEILPPAALGDLLRVARAGARMVVLIDGVFERALPVWHKEILWALGQGVHVWGGASMGALRAAELHAFGMRGVGRIFEGYRDGTLEADDEVAVLHGPTEAGFAAVSEALVNVRATLAAAEAAAVLDCAQAEAALGAARAIHYRDRTWGAVLERLGPAAAPLRAWLPTGRVDRKRLDALELLEAAQAFLDRDPPSFAAQFAFAWTDPWDVLFHATAPAESGVLDELRLRGDVDAVRRAGLLRQLALAEAERSGPLDKSDLARAGDALRERLGLWRGADLARWLAGVDLDEAGFAALCREEAAIAALLGRRQGALAAATLDELRVRGDYPTLAERARHKAGRLAAAGLDEAGPREVEGDLAPELARLAETLAARSASEPAGLARALGFSDRTDLERALLRELLYLRIIAANRSGRT
ncbi:MAG: TfuA-like protein [Geminicoccaceae bacterium]